jgi:hypothetical protein
MSLTKEIYFLLPQLFFCVFFDCFHLLSSSVSGHYLEKLSIRSGAMSTRCSYDTQVFSLFVNPFHLTKKSCLLLSLSAGPLAIMASGVYPLLLASIIGMSHAVRSLGYFSNSTMLNVWWIFHVIGSSSRYYCLLLLTLVILKGAYNLSSSFWYCLLVQMFFRSNITQSSTLNSGADFLLRS